MKESSVPLFIAAIVMTLFWQQNKKLSSRNNKGNVEMPITERSLLVNSEDLSIESGKSAHKPVLTTKDEHDQQIRSHSSGRASSSEAKSDEVYLLSPATSSARLLAPLVKKISSRSVKGDIIAIGIFLHYFAYLLSCTYICTYSVAY